MPEIDTQTLARMVLSSTVGGLISAGVPRDDVRSALEMIVDGWHRVPDRDVLLRLAANARDAHNAQGGA